MKVALNAQLLSTTPTYRSAGINRVIYELLARLRETESRLSFVAFAPWSEANRAFLHRAGIRPRLTRLPSSRPAVRVAWEQFALPAGLADERADLLHALAFISPVAWRGRTVVTIYDLSFLRFPEAYGMASRLYLRLMTPRSVRHADRVITISEHARQDVIDLYGIPAGRVVSIPLAADERYKPASAEQVAALRARTGLRRPFILYLGTIQPRKNLERLVRAYARLRKAGEIEHALVLAGDRGWLYHRLFDLVDALGLREDVMFPGYVPDCDQPLWYTAADIFAFPSLYEGFGLPPLEAMACGTPVVASNSSSLPEVVGDAGILVDPTDVAALATALGQLAASPSLRERLSQAGIRRAATFSWSRLARETVRVYQEVLRA